MMNIEVNEMSLPIAFEIDVTLASPVCLSKGVPTGNLTRTLNYIPGSTIRGMLAEFYLDQVGVPDATFEKLFLSGEVTYGNLYLSVTGAAATSTPLSARSCKHEPGFNADEDKHGVIDLLIQTFFWKWSEDQQHPSVLPTDSCSRCQAPLERFDRFYGPPTGTRQTVSPDSLRRIITRSATDDRLQTAEKGLLYSLEVLDPTAEGGYVPASGVVLCATTEAADLAQLHLLQPVFEETQRSFSIGTARSRGLGEIITAGRPLNSIDPLSQPKPLVDRFREFNQAIKETGVDDARLYFSLTLHSDAILQDEFFNSHSTIPARLLAWEVGLDADKLELETCFTDVHLVSGWNAGLRAPKTDVGAIRMGAAFLYSAMGIDESILINKLSEVEGRGLGARRTEGFGRVKVCDPFHVDARKEML